MASDLGLQLVAIPSVVHPFWADLLTQAFPSLFLLTSHGGATSVPPTSWMRTQGESRDFKLLHVLGKPKTTSAEISSQICSKTERADPKTGLFVRTLAQSVEGTNYGEMIGQVLWYHVLSWKEGKWKRLLGVNILGWCEFFSLGSVDVALLMPLYSDSKMHLYASKTVVEKWKEPCSFFLIAQPPAPLLPQINTRSRHKDTLFPLDCEHGLLSLNVSGKWLIWSHLPKSYWNAAVVRQLFKTPEIHWPTWHFPVFGRTIATALDIFYMYVYV